MEPGQRVHVGELAGLAKPLGIVDRGRRGGGELLETGHLALFRPAVLAPPEDGEGSDGRTLPLADRHRDAALDELRPGLAEAALVVRVAVADAHGAGAAGRGRRDRLARGLLGGHPDRRHQGLVLGPLD